MVIGDETPILSRVPSGGLPATPTGPDRISLDVDTTQDDDLIAAADIVDRDMASSSARGDPIWANDPWPRGGSKRAHVETGQSSSAPRSAAHVPVLLEDMQLAMGRMSSSIQSHINKSTCDLNTILSQSMQEGMVDLEAKMLQRMERQEEETRRAHHRIDSHDAQLRDLSDAPQCLARMEARQAALEAMVRENSTVVSHVQDAVRAEVAARSDDRTDPDYAAPPDPAILQVHVQMVVVQKSVVMEACRTWLAQDFQEDQWELVGPVEGKRFSVRFKALPKTAQSQAKKAIDILRPKAAGDPWVDVCVASGGQSHKLFVNPDASPQQQRLQAIQRRAKEVLLSMYPATGPPKNITLPKPFYHPKKQMEGFVRIRGQDILSVRADSRSDDPILKLEPCCHSFQHSARPTFLSH